MFQFLRYFQNRTTPPAPVVFKFDEALLDGLNGNVTSVVLNPTAVVLDDLTIDSLKLKQQENQTK
jgi:hypothetical protein